jgi:arylformamidase
MNQKRICLSYFIDESTPTYGNRNVAELTKKSSMDRGDAANETHIRSTLHIGTHIDFPYHFYNDGQTMEDFPIDFWFFEHPLLVEVKPQSFILEQELILTLENVNEKEKTDILIVKTGMCNIRNTQQYWEENIGLSPLIYDYLQEKLPKVRIIGFDSISVSCFQHRDIGRLAHKKFLNPEKSILLLEDMDLRNVNENSGITEVIIAPLMIAGADGVPCTVIALSQIN